MGFQSYFNGQPAGHISDTNDPNDFEAFTEIRKKIADYIIAIDPNS
jgi:hypothetical protein